MRPKNVVPLGLFKSPFKSNLGGKVGVDIKQSKFQIPSRIAEYSIGCTSKAIAIATNIQNICKQNDLWRNCYQTEDDTVVGTKIITRRIEQAICSFPNCSAHPSAVKSSESNQYGTQKRRASRASITSRSTLHHNFPFHFPLTFRSTLPMAWLQTVNSERQRRLEPRTPSHGIHTLPHCNNGLYFCCYCRCRQDCDAIRCNGRMTNDD
jgi:hypothetical protein